MSHFRATGAGTPPLALFQTWTHLFAKIADQEAQGALPASARAAQKMPSFSLDESSENAGSADWQEALAPRAPGK